MNALTATAGTRNGGVFPPSRPVPAAQRPDAGGVPAVPYQG